MSVRIHRWFGLPPELLETGTLTKMSPSGVRLYLYLCWKSDRQSSREFRARDSEIIKLTGASGRSLTNARAELKRLGLVQLEVKTSGGEHTYTLCDIRTMLPYPGDARALIRGVRKETAVQLGSPRQEPAKVTAPPPDCETDFDFGCNVANSSHNIPNGFDAHDFNPFLTKPG